MRICFIADGRSIHTQRWTEHFGKSHEVYLITYDPSGRVLDGVTEHVIGFPFRNIYLAFWPRHFLIRRLIQKINPDLVHAHFITKYGFHLPFLGKYPKIVSAWGDDILVIPSMSRLLNWFTRLTLNSADFIYAISGDIRSHIIHDFDIPEEKVKYCPIGVDTNLFSPRNEEPEKKEDDIDIFSNRGFLPIYGMETLVRGFYLAYTQNHRLHLTLKGDGDEKNRIMHLVRELGLDDAVTFLDRTSYKDIPEDLRRADIYVTPAGRDGTPVSLLEAMSSGLPCIATAVGGVPEWIENGKNGILIEPYNPSMLAEKILMLVKDRETRQRLGFNARMTIRKRGDWDKIMVEVEKDYQAILEPPPA